MNKTVWAGVLLGMMTMGAMAQSVKDAENRLRDSLVKKQFFLRGFSEDSTIDWRWNGKELVEDEPKFLTLGALTVKSVKLNGEKVVIQGDRQVLERTEGQNVQFSAEIVPVTINVDLHGANVADVLPALPHSLFYGDMQEAVQRIPAGYKDLLPAKAPLSEKPAETTCDCAQASACKDDVALMKMGGVKPPRSSGLGRIPSTSQNAGFITTVVALDEKGHVQYVWLGRPVAMDVDDALLRVVKASSFSPATCHDKPMAVAFPFSVHVNAEQRMDEDKRGRR